MAMTAAMKNVLSPISDAPMTPAAYKRDFEAIQAAAAAGYLTQPPEKQAGRQFGGLGDLTTMQTLTYSFDKSFKEAAPCCGCHGAYFCRGAVGKLIYKRPREKRPKAASGCCLHL
jgi:hypothetical protein